MKIESKKPSLILSLMLIVAYILMVFLLKDILPSSEEILNSFSKVFTRFGYEIVFFGAFLEAALIIDLLAPGTSVVLAGAFFAGQGLLSYPIFLAVAAAGFFLGYLLDYLVGFYGLSDILVKFGFGNQLQKVHNQVEKWGGKAFFIGYFHPDTATIFAVAAGIVKMDIKEFIVFNFLAGFLWLSFWTGLVYLFGSYFKQFFDNDLLWIVFLLPLVLLSLNIIKDRKIFSKILGS
ncbi:DedA family protein [Candidatus Daviesbacteria bacterium]|nr:DedA family protein [Candidatus Daviesbacteria bacterium]